MSLIHGRLVYPAVVRSIGEGALFSRLRDLQGIERWSPGALEQYQAERLASLLQYAQRHSPFYSRRWPPSIPGDREAARAYLAELPLVTKRDVQEHYGDMIAQPPVGRVSHKITGGSTGQAVTVTKDRRATAYERAAMWLGYGWRGVHIGDRAARFWGAPFAARRKVLTRLSDYAMNRIRFSAFAFSEAELEEYWRRCLEFHPAYFHGYVSMLETFAAFVADRGYDGRQLGLKSIIATSEVLGAPQRALLERVFGAPVQIEYGCGELGPIAYECEHGSLHLMTADLVIEVLGPDGQPVQPGEAGEIVVTDLNNRAMPLVRYQLGDFGTPGGECNCGRAFPVLKHVWGRAYDFVGRPDGTRYHGEFFMYLFEDLRQAGMGVQAFQVTQYGPETLDVAIVPRPDTIGADQMIRQMLADRLPGMHVHVHSVAAVERTPSGKMQLIRNVWARSSAEVQETTA